MSGIHFQGLDLYDSLIEVVGFKCGLGIDYGQLKDILRKDDWSEYAELDEQSYVRLDPTTYEHIAHDLMRAFGRAEGEFNPHPHISLMHKYKRDRRLQNIYNDSMEAYSRWLKIESNKVKQFGGMLNPEKLLRRIHRKHGADGLKIVMEILHGLQSMLVATPWSNSRQMAWENQLDLKDLFESEGLDVVYGSFIDQRFIDFLHRNFPKVDDMHWRKFEQMTAEFLDREGYDVKLGPGRGDGGVDVRAWSKDKNRLAPVIIAQCKREKSPVKDVIVKALYADIIHEEALSGLIVTTSRLAPGADQTRLARAYPIDVADRATLAQWLRSMRVPGVGGDLFSD